MLQKKFFCRDKREIGAVIEQVRLFLENNAHQYALLTFYEKGFSKDDINSFVTGIKACCHSQLHIAGISLTLIAEFMPEGTGMLLNLVLSDETEFEILTMPCLPGEESFAAKELHERIEKIGNVKAVELFGSNMALKITRFMKEAMAGHEDIVLFGTTTIRNLPTKLSTDENTVEIKQIDPDYEQNEFAVGTEILTDGFVAVLFYGESLNVQSTYALGWKPVGRKLDIDFCESESKGETVIKTINGIPAVDIYREYLGVYPDSYLISNICEFPFIVERNGINICLIPIDCGKDGELYFMMTLEQGESIRFTFASHDEVLFSSGRALDKMEEFRPEALFLTLCGNRINFLKEDAVIEWEGFKSLAPDYALMHGACELLYHNGKGGILNSAHLAVGMREGNAKTDVKIHDHMSLESLHRGKVLSLSDRMSVFLSRITEELQGMAQTAEDANNAKSAFLSHMSHEIRTPINAILGMNELILQDSMEDDTLEYSENIRSAGYSLLAIVNDILDLSKIEAGRMNIIPIEYKTASMIKDLYNVVSQRAADKGIEIRFDIDPEIPSMLFGDETRIKQVVTNLLTNAVKYTEYGRVILSIRKVFEENKECRLKVAVSDTGIGIRKEDIERLFDEYQRLDEKRNRGVEGTGLGLSITVELLELMDSKLTVESTYGKGSTFGFEINQGVIDESPVGEIDDMFKRSAVRKYRLRFTVEDARILVVDDSAVNLSVVKNLLKKTKINVDTAASGKEALRLVSENEYDVILLDHLMPDMDGPETLRRMRELKTNLSSDAPVISLTANATAAARDEYINAGFKDYLPKPVSGKELEDMLYHYIPSEKIKTLPSLM